MSSFTSFGLLPSLLRTVEGLGFDTPTEIQTRAIPPLMRGDSVVGIAETGSGKTLAYVLPVLHDLKQLELDGDAVSEPGMPRAVVVAPTSDLGEQVAKVFKSFTHETRLRVRSVLGGNAKVVARRNVAAPFEVLLATPGRLEQLMDIDAVRLDDVRMLVVDEADLLLDAGFLPSLKRFFLSAPEDCQRALFSATATTDVQALIKDLFRPDQVIQTEGSHMTVRSLFTDNREVKDGKRWPVFESVLSQRVEGGTLVFVNTRAQCDALSKLMFDHGYAASIYRGDMDKKERRANLRRFREGRVDVLICTDLGARGLDLEGVNRVVNYHMPKEFATYLHRAGRTARAGRKGTIVNLVTKRDEPLVEKFGRRMR